MSLDEETRILSFSARASNSFASSCADRRSPRLQAVDRHELFER
jgi:hypothetical protein